MVVALVPDDVAPTHLDGLPPELDADFATRVAADGRAHLECQGYRDGGRALRRGRGRAWGEERELGRAAPGVVVAAMRERYKSMVRTIEHVNPRPVLLARGSAVPEAPRERRAAHP